jgi:hypothetical protein
MTSVAAIMDAEIGRRQSLESEGPRHYLVGSESQGHFVEPPELLFWAYFFIGFFFLTLSPILAHSDSC